MQSTRTIKLRSRSLGLSCALGPPERPYHSELCGSGYLSRYNDSLGAGRSGGRIPVRFYAPVQTGSGACPASYTTGNGSLSGGKAVGAWRRTPAPSSAEVNERA